MKIQGKDYIWIACLGVAVLLFLNIGIQIGLRRNPPTLAPVAEETLQPDKPSEPSIVQFAREEKNTVFPQLELLGTILGNPSVAFIYNPITQGRRLYKVNDVIENTKVVSILSGKVVLEKEGVRRELLLLAHAAADTQKADSFVAKDESGTMVINKFQMMGQLLKANEILAKVKIVPLADTATHKLRGFRIANVPSGSIIEDAGIRDGDVIYSVQGQQLQSMQDALTMFNRIQNQSRIEVVLLRDDKPVTLRYEIRN